MNHDPRYKPLDLDKQIRSIVPEEELAVLSEQGIAKRLKSAGVVSVLVNELNKGADQMVVEMLNSPEGQEIRERIVTTWPGEKNRLILEIGDTCPGG